LGVPAVICGEGLIGCKFRGIINEPRRAQHRDDIRAPLRAYQVTLDTAEVRAYFRPFGREALPDELLHEADRRDGRRRRDRCVRRERRRRIATRRYARPLETRDDLMVVVEALCPTRPARSSFKAPGIYLL
jgi:hypothetical protein